MSDEPSKFILGDTAISALEEHPGGKRGFFGRKRRTRTQLAHCENCGAQLTGRYCAECGQAAIDYRRSFRHVIIDILDSFLNWDSKFFATIGLLIAKPWRLTNEFLAGRRVRYLHPLRLYLLISILFFLGVNQFAKNAHFQPSNVHREMSPEDRAKMEEALKNVQLPSKARAKMEKALKRDDARKAAKEASPAPAQAENKVPDDEDKDFIMFSADKEAPKNEFEKWLNSRLKEKVGENGVNAKVLFIALLNNLPAMMLCAIPLFAFVLKILYIRKRVFYIDHLIYALHIHAFAYLAIMLIVAATMGLFRITSPTLAGWIVGFLWTTLAVQVFLSIRRVYKQGWFFTIFKFLLGGFVYFIVLCMALAVTFFVTLALP